MQEENKQNIKKNPSVKTDPLVHDFNQKGLKSSFTPKILVVFIGIVILGLISGYMFAGKNGAGVSNNSISGGIFNGSSSSKGTVVGSSDTSTFKDTAEGVLKQGGVDGEGAFHLERNGGPSQNVYLTSSIVDLSKFIDKKVKVWGQTQKAQTAGWLMDVGRVEVL